MKPNKRKELIDAFEPQAKSHGLKLGYEEKNCQGVVYADDETETIWRAWKKAGVVNSDILDFAQLTPTLSPEEKATLKLMEAFEIEAQAKGLYLEYKEENCQGITYASFETQDAWNAWKKENATNKEKPEMTQSISGDQKTPIKLGITAPGSTPYRVTTNCSVSTL